MFPVLPAKSAPTPAPPRPAADYGPGSAAARATAKKLETIAARREFAARERQLRSLAAALRDPAEAGLWRGLSVHHAFADLTAEATARWRVAARLLPVVRAIAVFLPLLVSWWGIHDAVDAYSAQLEDDPDQGAQAFFREWLGGFGGEVWLSFDVMALLVVACIIGLIAVSALTELLQRKAEDEAARAADDLDYALTEAALHLQAAPSADPEDAQRRLEEISTRSADLVEALLDTVKAVQGELAVLKDATGEFRTVVTGLEHGAFAIADTTAKLDSTVSGEQNRAAQAFQDAGTAVADRLGTTAAEIQTAVADLQQQALQMLAQVGQIMTEAVSQGERNRDALGLLMRDSREDDARALADAIARRQTELADELRRAGQDIAAKLESAVEVSVDPQVQQRLDALDQTNRQLNTAMGALAQSVQYLGQALGQQSQLVPLKRSKFRFLKR